MKKLHKKGMAPIAWVIIGVIALMAFGVIPKPNFGGISGGGGTTVVTQQAAQPATVILQDDGCPDTKLTALVFNAFNTLNTTATDNFDVSLRLYGGANEQWMTTIIDTTNPSSTNVRCNAEITAKILSVDGDAQDNAGIHSATVDFGSVSTTPDREAIKFKAQGSTQSFSIQGEKHGVLQFRGYDDNLKSLLYNAGETNQNDFDLTAVNYTTTASNSSYNSIGIGETFKATLEVQSTTPYTDFFDLGGYVCVDHSTTTWDKQAFKLNGGADLNDAKLGGLTPYESKLFSNWEECFEVPITADLTTRNTGKFYLEYRANADPVASDTDNIVLYFYGKGHYADNFDSNIVRTGAATNAPNPVAVFTRQTAQFSIG